MTIYTTTHFFNDLPQKYSYTFFERSDTVQGAYEFTNVNNGYGSTTCLKLNYHGLAGWYPCRAMPKFRKKCGYRGLQILMVTALFLVMGGKNVIAPSDSVTELVVIKQRDLATWRCSESPEATLKVIRSAPQVAVIGKHGRNDAYGKFFERSLKDGIAVVIVGTTNNDK